MSLAIGTKLGPYEIVAPLGAGGMGEVYRATDSHLKRSVAIKVLPASMAADADRLARFQREAEVLAALNHPNIAAIYGLEKTADFTALVMELVEGEDLSAVIGAAKATPYDPTGMPLSDALPIARQIAEALEAAHEAGIIHRDLKPQNIKVRADGTVKVLDFGLAKAMDPATSAPQDPINSPTMTARMTQMGMILGTAAYMAPEQAKGKPMDKRADIWAFGVVLHEMLSGQHLFLADTIPETLAHVMTRPIDLGTLPAATPRRVRDLIARCLEKDPKKRLRDIGEARLILDDPAALDSDPTRASSADAPATPVAPGWQRALPWAIAALAVAVAGWTYLSAGRGATASSNAVTYLDIGSPPDVEFVRLLNGGYSISPDGRTIAMIGVRDNARRLFIRSLDRAEAREIPDTLGVNGVTFSPDGTSVTVITNGGEVMRISLADEQRTLIATGADTTSVLAWSSEGVVFTRAGALWIAAPGDKDGDAPRTRALTTLGAARREVLHGMSMVLPGGRTAVFASMTSDAGGERVEAVPVAGGARIVLVERANTPVWSPTGHLLFSRDGVMLAVPLDPAVPRVTGPAVPVIPAGVIGQQSAGGLTFRLSTAGTLLYAPADYNTNRLVSVTRDGAATSLDLPPAGYTNPRVSPDGRRVLVESDATVIEALDLARGTHMRLTTPALGISFATWMTDGERVLFRRFNVPTWIAADGSGREGVLPHGGASDYPSAAGPDADSVLVVRAQPDTAGDIFLMSLTGTFEPRALIDTRAYEGGPQLSPDGRWLLYQSNASGTAEIFVRRYPELDRAFQVSAGGGAQPRWNPATMEVCYRSGGRIVAVPFDGRSTEPIIGTPQRLFADEYEFGQGISIPNYDITRDGRFLMLRRGDRSGTLRAALHWTEEL
ncbi:MAG TPA: protein kinase, partial [Vicinamibacterales bacterium]|nr:protein kinase [Vicinamibacterales bacterium]